jgi:excisionase family DNA binding protein
MSGDATGMGLARIREAMTFLAVSRTKLYEMMGNGELSYVKFGKARRVPWPELVRLVERQTQSENRDK